MFHYLSTIYNKKESIKKDIKDLHTKNFRTLVCNSVYSTKIITKISRHDSTLCYNVTFIKYWHSTGNREWVDLRGVVMTTAMRAQRIFSNPSDIFPNIFTSQMTQTFILINILRDKNNN